MKTFLDDSFLLENQTAECLYHDYAKDQPIIDYHCHLSPDQVAVVIDDRLILSLVVVQALDIWFSSRNLSSRKVFVAASG